MATFEDSLQQDFGCVDSVTSASLMSPPDSSGGHGEPAAASEPAVVSEDPAVSVPNTNEELRPSPKRTLKRHFGRMDDPHAAPALTGEEPADTGDWVHKTASKLWSSNEQVGALSSTGPDEQVGALSSAGLDERVGALSSTGPDEQ
eukprot:gene26761-32881_t